MRWLFVLLSLLLLITPDVALADNVFSSLVNLQPPPGDMAMEYLGYVFGTVGNVLTGNGSQILGAMFRVFNSVVLALGAIIMMYILLTSTLNTAQDGEVLGKKWSSMWIPMRAALGVGLLIPQASGYSLIQVIIMWLVIQGVGAADSIWNGALDYLKNGGILVSQGQQANIVVTSVAGQMLKQEVCMYALQDVINKNSAISGASPIDFSTTVTSPIGSPNGGMAKFPANQDNFPGTLAVPGIVYDANGVADRSYAGACGVVKWDNLTVPGDAAQTAQYQQYQISGIVQMFNGIDALAQAIVSSSDVQDILYTPTIPSPGLSLDEVMSGSTAILDASKAYEGVMQPLMNTVGDRNNGFISDAEGQGWMAAGQYYYDLATINSQVSIDMNQAKPHVTFSPNAQMISSAACGTDDPSACAFAGNLDSLLTGDNSPLNSYINAELAQSSSGTTHGTMDMSAGGNVGDSVLSNALSMFTNGLSDIIMGFAELQDAKNSHVNPVFAASTLGSGLVVFITYIWITLTVVIFIVGVASTGSCVNPFFSMLGNAVIWFMPVMMAMMGALFLAGAVMAYYLPLIPYILMTFAALGWLIGVVESLIAAPLVALGIAHPEGHDIFGKGEHAIMLILNIFIRPSLIIFGFVTAIIMSYVGIWFLNEGFGRALGVWGASIHGYAWLGAVIAIIIIYSGLAMAIIHKSFAMIHIIPDQILRWIGGGQHQFGEGQGEEQVRGSFSTGAKAIGDSGGAGMQEQAGAARKKQMEGGGSAKGETDDGRVDHSKGVQGPQPESKPKDLQVAQTPSSTPGNGGSSGGGGGSSSGGGGGSSGGGGGGGGGQ